VFLTRDIVAAHDLVFVMEPNHLERLRRRWPHEQRRYFLLPHFAEAPGSIGSYERHHLVDPYGKPLEAFVACYARIDAAVRSVVDRISEGLPGPRGGALE
jgi:protein-tyrosine-phosphatase